MNKDKVGEPFHYPNTFFFYLDIQNIFSFAHRQTEGVAQGRANGKLPPILNFITICKKRINRLDIKIKDITNDKEFKDEYLIIIMDSAGIKVTN